MTIKSFITKSAALAAVTVAIAAGAMSATPAEAGHKHHHKKVGIHLMLGAPIVYGGYGYSGYYGYQGHGSCHWLYHKAKNTGSKYWWKRFNECRYGW